MVLLFCLRLEIFDLFSVLFLELILLTKKSLGRYVDYFLSVVALLLQLTDFRLGQLGLAVLLLDDGILGGNGRPSCRSTLRNVTIDSALCSTR